MVTCGDGEEWQGDLGCVATQRPEEVIGRQVDGPNGEVCTVTDAALDVSCSPPSPAP